MKRLRKSIMIFTDEKSEIIKIKKETDEDITKRKKRKQLASKIMLVRDALNPKSKDRATVEGILISLKTYPTGLSIYAIDTLNQITVRNNLSEKINHQLADGSYYTSETLKPYERVVVGRKKLSAKTNLFLAYFAKVNDLPETERIPIQIKFTDIRIRKDLYLRRRDKKIYQAKIAEYELLSEEQLTKDPILVNQKYELIDGYMRLMALKRQKKNENDFDVMVVVFPTKDDNHLKRQMYEYNNEHGLPISKEQKRDYARELKNQKLKSPDIARIIGVAPRTIRNWVQDINVQQQKDQKKKVIELDKKGKKQGEIANIVGISQKQVSNIINDSKNGKTAKTTVSITPYPRHIFATNVWTIKLKEVLSDDKYPGKTPEIYLENLFHYHTRKGNAIYDPFSGSGTTHYVANEMKRISFCYDRVPLAGKGIDDVDGFIKPWDITNGLPKDLPEIDFVYIDPPYSTTSEKIYSLSKTDLGNMTVDDFNKEMKNLFNELKKIKVKTLSFIIKPTIWDRIKRQFIYIDHTLDFHDMIKDQYRIIARYTLSHNSGLLKSLSTKAKRERKTFYFTRDLLVYQRKGITNIKIYGISKVSGYVISVLRKNDKKKLEVDIYPSEYNNLAVGLDWNNQKKDENDTQFKKRAEKLIKSMGFDPKDISTTEVPHSKPLTLKDISEWE